MSSVCKLVFLWVQSLFLFCLSIESAEVSRIDCPEGPLKNKHSMMDLMNAEVISTPRLTGPFGLRPLVLRRRQGKPLKNWFMIKAVRNKQLVQPIPV
jgi:hypothetical protein